MAQTNTPSTSRRKAELKISTKISVLIGLFSDGDLNPLLEKLDVTETLELHRFMWEKTVEFGIKAQDKKFSRSDITHRWGSVSEYQHSKNCTKPVSACLATRCLDTNPLCALEKLQRQIRIMGRAIGEYVGLTEKSTQLQED